MEEIVMKIKMKLLSDTIFGSGLTNPGQEDISVLVDEDGFPYYKGGTFKGIFREALEQYFMWQGDNDAEQKVTKLLGCSADDDILNERKLVFSDFTLSGSVKKKILAETDKRDDILNALTNERVFTSIDDSGTVQKGSLRNARCVDKGLWFYSEIRCDKEDEETIKEVLSIIHWIGTMRNRGFGHVTIECEAD